MELESLAVPQANAAEEAGKLIQDLPRLWTGANMAERRKLLLTMLDAVYVETKEEKRIVAIKPKPPFRPVFHVAATKEGSGVILLNEPPENSPEARACFWWRRGRVELPVQRNLRKTCYRLS
jgi:site-specific DNA recombinase